MLNALKYNRLESSVVLIRYHKSCRQVGLEFVQIHKIGLLASSWLKLEDGSLRMLLLLLLLQLLLVPVVSCHGLNLCLGRSFAQLDTVFLDFTDLGEAVNSLQMVLDIFDPFKVLATEATRPVLDIGVGDHVTLEIFVSKKHLVTHRTADVSENKIFVNKFFGIESVQYKDK